MFGTFCHIVDDISKEDDFIQWTRNDICRNPPSPISLLLLGFLRLSGRNFTLDDLEEVTAIGRKKHRRFIHKFIQYGSTKLWKDHVKIPVNNDKILYCESLF